MATQMQQQQHAPYRPTVWAFGGTPTKDVDVPITAVFLALFIVGAAIHMTIFQINRRRGHKFLFNAVIFGFCMSRIVTCTLRIASILLPQNLNLLIAASIFVAAGVLILYIINFIWAQRILRSLHPTIGWHPAVSVATKLIYVLIACTLAIIITSVVQMYFTLDPHIRSIDRGLQLYGQTYFAFVSTLPLLVLLAAFTIPRTSEPEAFGKGSLRTKSLILLTSSLSISLAAWYRCGTSWKRPVPRTQPLPDYFEKAAFYVLNFGVEIVTVYMYALARVDRRFHVPDGAKGPGSYVVKGEGKKEGEEELGEVESAQ